MKIDRDQLKRQGWHLSEEAVKDLAADFTQVGDVTKHLLETDLRDVGSTWVPEGLRKNKVERLEMDGILQVMKIRNISASNDHQDSKFAPRFLRIIATDGKESVSLLDMDHHPKLSIDTPPGSKIFIKNKPNIWDGHVIIKRNCVEVLGGSVQRLVEAWKLKRDFNLASGGGPMPRRAADGSGPPPFIPFGSRQMTKQVKAVKGFRAMDKVRETGQSANQPGEVEEENDTEFDSHRRAVIEEARQQGKDASSKLKGFAHQKNVKLPPGRGVEQMERQEDIKKVAAMGFQPRDAAAALRKTGGDVQKAVDSLLADRTAGVSLDDGSGRDRGRGRGKGRGRKGKGDPMDSDDEGPSRAPPPSGPATLADFVTKKAEKPEIPSFNPQPPAQRPADSFSPGDQVMARWRDGKTYRARVEEVYRADGVISILFMDYGEHDVIPLEHVQHMHTSKPQLGRPSSGRGRGSQQPQQRQSSYNDRHFGNEGQRPSSAYTQPPPRDQRQQRFHSGRPDQYDQYQQQQPSQYDPYSQYHDYRPQNQHRYEQQPYQTNFVNHQSYGSVDNFSAGMQYHDQQQFAARGMEFRRGGQGRFFNYRGGRR